MSTFHDYQASDEKGGANPMFDTLDRRFQEIKKEVFLDWSTYSFEKKR